MRYLLLLIPILVGMGVVVQAGANTQLRYVLQNPFLAGLISLTVATLTLILINLLLRTDFSVLSTQNIQRTQWWMWTGGLVGASFILSVVLVAPEIGPTRLFSLIIASQLIFSLVVDHYGWMGFAEQPITLKQLAGVTLLVVGAFLVQAEPG